MTSRNSPQGKAVYEAGNCNAGRVSDHGWKGRYEGERPEYGPAALQISPCFGFGPQPMQDALVVDEEEDCNDEGEDAK